GRLFSVSHFRVPHILLLLLFINLFSFTHPSTTNHPTLSLHDALPIFCPDNRNADTHLQSQVRRVQFRNTPLEHSPQKYTPIEVRSEEHTSELQSRENLVCRLLLEKKKKNNISWHNKTKIK